ncbi:MAG: TolC family protein [Betaproteobacteria bacterium]|nr:TolC family protein [Betaproteobacteria bacterium]
MRRPFLVLAIVALPALALATEHEGRSNLTLDAAWALAEQANPELRKAQAALDAARGELTDASGLLFNNPAVSMENQRRSRFRDEQPDTRGSEWGGALSQTFEIAGQQGFRREAARAGLSALEQEIAEARRRVRAGVEGRFVQVLALQARIETERRTLDLIERNTQFTRKRVEAGEDSKLDGNQATVDAERARNQLSVLREQLVRARADLAALLQLPERELPTATGELMPRETRYTLDGLLASVSSRPIVRALDLREQSARNRLDLERAARYPDVTIGLRNILEKPEINARDRITTVEISVPLPLFRRNAAGIGRASTELTQTQIDKAAVARDARAAVVAAWLRQESLRDRVKRLAEAVRPKLEENLSLSQRAFQDGEIGLPQLLLVQRQTLDAQRDVVEAQLELRLAQIELEYAAGWPADQPSTK